MIDWFIFWLLVALGPFLPVWNLWRAIYYYPPTLLGIACVAGFIVGLLVRRWA
ncbi:MAG: hypothetical protein NXI32_04870 [bacterium]|nr:hypothetical protein [bacterium]